MISDTFRLELGAFDIKVVELKTGLVRTNFSPNVNADRPTLIEGSIYEPARPKVEKMLKSESFDGQGMDPQVWANKRVKQILKHNPPPRKYCGESAWFAWLIPKLPFGLLDGTLKKIVGLDEVERML